MELDLIYDIGMHTGLDTKFYLDKGFRVVALEANPKLVNEGQQKFSEAISANRLHIVDRAISSGDEEEVSFFVNDTKDDWSSLMEGNANREGKGVEKITVKTIHVSDMFAKYGAPYYLKCDIEGADEMFVDQLLEQDHRPPFLSVEAAGETGIRTIAKLFCAGYDRMQIVNQAFNQWTTAPQPALEGQYVETRFNGHMSGLFGKELPKEKWETFELTMANYLKFLDLKAKDESLAHGWTDVHVTTQAFVGG